MPGGVAGVAALIAPPYADVPGSGFGLHLLQLL